MYKPDDKDIDRLSRDAAEHYQAPGKPGWETLQQILDKELPQEKEKKRRGFFFFFILLLAVSVAGSGIWYGIKINNKNKSITLTDQANIKSKKNNLVEKQSAATNNDATENSIPASASTVKPKDVVKKNNDANEKVVPVTEQETAVSNNTTNKIIKPAPLSVAGNNGRAVTSAHRYPNIDKHIKNNVYTIKQGTATGKPKNNYSGKLHTNRNNQIIPGAGIANGSTKNNTVIEKSNGEEPGIAANDNTDKTKKDTDVPVTSKNNDGPVNAVQDTLFNKPTTVNAVPAVDAVTKMEKKDSAIAKKKVKSKNEKAINIGLTAGLDLSTVKFTHRDNIGYNFGLMGGYQFSKHWSVYTGVIYTKKNYELNGDDYHPPKHYWTQYVQLETVEGYCRMWEIPLLARYTFNPDSKTSFFASTGISSYFMKEQAYNYSYKTMGVPATTSWNNDSSFNHVFSILHLSAGFEKRLGKHMNWQIEPYAKIPLGGVGFGNIRLSSFGINFSVQYRHPVKR
ncbi:MAG: porin family protein [Bacteroidota bacterium]